MCVSRNARCAGARACARPRGAARATLMTAACAADTLRCAAPASAPPARRSTPQHTRQHAAQHSTQHTTHQVHDALRKHARREVGRRAGLLPQLAPQVRELALECGESVWAVGRRMSEGAPRAQCTSAAHRACFCFCCARNLQPPPRAIARPSRRRPCSHRLDRHAPAGRAPRERRAAWRGYVAAREAAAPAGRRLLLLPRAMAAARLPLPQRLHPASGRRRAPPP